MRAPVPIAALPAVPQDSTWQIVVGQVLASVPLANAQILATLIQVVLVSRLETALPAEAVQLASIVVVVQGLMAHPLVAACLVPRHVP